ncbi:unnamed protein product [Caenorhabditis angaria]|uniref:Nuclear receptor domain-containing protein n=1 Tax=Caenorhabditis angaria TaxID=860376 RepID=A0A9P1N617_9PELO|nr:unnamed protein product [Caenorhabditis angaria]
MEIEKSKEKECLVCRKTSNGMHFGAISCRACAAFFRRATVLNIQYECKKGDMDCNIEGRGRFVCRYCRFLKCQQIGMKPDKVQLDYDPTYSIKGLLNDDSGSEGSRTNSPSCSKSEEESEDSEDQKYKTKINPDFLFNFSPKPSNKPMAKIDFSDLSQKIEYLFDCKTEETEKDDLEILTNSISDIPKNPQIQEIHQMEIFDIIHLLKNETIWKWAKWMNSSQLLKTIEKQQKMQLFRNSWNILHIFERLYMTSKNSSELLTSNGILISDELLWICGKSYYNISSISEITNQYFSTLFNPYLQRFIDLIGKQLYKMQLTNHELTFCLIQLLGYDTTDLTQNTIEIIENLKHQIADQMHNYYSNYSDLTNYSYRLIKLINIVKSMKKISIEKNKVKELFYIFDIFHADISDPYFFDIF